VNGVLKGEVKQMTNEETSQTLCSKDCDRPIKGSEKYSFCESSTASGMTWHIRKLDDTGKHLSGGITTPSLCNRVKPNGPGRGELGGWDVNPDITPHHLGHCCRDCWEAFMKETEHE
jgi:hypothetical protein